jgi:MFS family permease
MTVGLGWLSRRFSEARITRAALLLATSALAVYALASVAWVLYPSLGLFGFSAAGFATLSLIVTRAVPPSSVGEAQGVAASVHALVDSGAPLIYPILLDATEGSALPGAAFLLAAGVMSLAFLLSLALESFTDAPPGGTPAQPPAAPCTSPCCAGGARRLVEEVEERCEPPSQA